jgi:hypothetical protein
MNNATRDAVLIVTLALMLATISMMTLVMIWAA